MVHNHRLVKRSTKGLHDQYRQAIQHGPVHLRQQDEVGDDTVTVGVQPHATLAPCLQLRTQPGESRGGNHRPQEEGRSRAEGEEKEGRTRSPVAPETSKC